MVDDLSAPLGQDRKKQRRFVLPKAVPNAVAVALAAIVLGFGLWAVIVEDPLGGEPVAVVSTQAHPPPQAGAGADAAARGPEKPTADALQSAAASADKTAAPGTQTVTIIDGMSGKREQVVINAPAARENPKSSPAEAPRGPAAPASGRAAPLDPRVAENSRHGTIPKVAADGTRAVEIYARAPDKAASAGGGGPRVAIVVGRLGISANNTSEALAKLPGAVTLAFAPYGNDLERWVARARGEGREVLLQVPMEPHDYPDNDPGPQTLLISLPPEQNIDRLHWFMSRFQGYVGIANYMGARFTTNDQAVATVVREAGKRGLIYFDDGAAARSSAGQVAGASNVPFAKADLVIDATPTPAEIDGALARLEALARERGVAVGAAGALPVSIDRIAKWAKAAAARGITLVPISMVAIKPKSS